MLVPAVFFFFLFRRARPINYRRVLYLSVRESFRLDEYHRAVDIIVGDIYL